MAALGRPIVLDGSHGEGGGALVRAALAMSALTEQAVRIEGIRSGTKFPGLDFEDLVLMKALASSCAAETTGAEVGATSISFLPTRRPRALNGDLGPDEQSDRRTASVPVVFNALLPVLARSGSYSQVALSGETYGNRSLSFDYFQNVTIPALQRLGLCAFPDQELAAFGRQSPGRLTMDVEPSAFQSVDWSIRGKLIGCHALVTSAELPPSISERGVSHLENLARSAKIPIEVEINPVDAHVPGAFVTVWAVCERGMGGAGAMGARGVRIETLAQRAFEETLSWLRGDATVDPFLADQLLITACLAEGETKMRVSRLTQRFLTSVWVVKQFLPIHITIRGGENDAGDITIKQ